MKIDINLDVYLHSESDGKVLSKLTEILLKLNQMEKTMALDLSELQAKVEANAMVSDSAVILLKGLKAKLDEAIASNDPALLKALSDALGADTQELADAILANTPAA